MVADSWLIVQYQFQHRGDMGISQKPPTSSRGALQGLSMLAFLAGYLIDILSTTDVTKDGAGTGKGEVERLSWGRRGRGAL